MQILIYLGLGLIIGYLIGKNQNKESLKQVQDDSGENAVNQQRAEEKQKHLDKILVSFGSGEEITNDQAEHLLGVSNTSAERYLDELEKAGKLAQVGKTSRSVVYRKA